MVTANRFSSGQVVPYLRGNIWNDDPVGDLFDWNDQDWEQWNWASGITYAWDFKFGSSNGMLKRSHFGDLQFLHSMATRSCICPKELKTSIMRWAEFTYKVATGVFSPCSSLCHVRLDDGLDVGHRFGIGCGLVGKLMHTPRNGVDVCNCPSHQDLSNKHGWHSVHWAHCSYANTYTANGRRRWWARGTCRCHGGYSSNWDGDFKQCPGSIRGAWYDNARKRAAGSLVHMIQDSFARGHSDRETTSS